MRSRRLLNWMRQAALLGALLLGVLGICPCLAGNLPPVITTQPVSQTVMVGSHVTFSVEASSLSPVSYQWRKNGINIAGATSSSYSMANVQTNDQGSYSVIVTNVGGMAVSTNASLTVVIPAIPIDNLSSAITNGTALSWPHTIGSGNNRILMVGVAIHNSSRTVTSATYGTEPLTLVGESVDGNGKVKVALYQLVAPPVGTAYVAVVIDSSDRMSGGAVSLTGVSQVSPTGTFASAGGSGLTGAVTVSSAAGETVLDIMGATGDALTLTPSAGQLPLWNRSEGTGSSDVVAGTSARNGAPTVGMSWTLGASKPWAIGAVSLKPAANTAPSLDSMKSPTLLPQSARAGAPYGSVGTLVSQLVDISTPSGQLDNVSDPDSGALLGIAVVGADTENGGWFYSVNNGSSWNALGNASDIGARLLAADANTRLYFQPNADFSGTLTNAITFRAWDQTSGTNGGTADTADALSFTVADNFPTAAYTGNSGSRNWTGDWQEIEESDGAGEGQVRVTSAYTGTYGGTGLSGYAIELRAGLKTGQGMSREVNLSGTATATLSFDYGVVHNNNATVVLSVNSGAGWQTLKTYSLIADVTSAIHESFDLSAYATAITQIRFQVTASGLTTAMYVDNVQIAAGAPSHNGGATAFSTATDTAFLLVNPINHAPSLASSYYLGSINEDNTHNPGKLVATMLAGGFSDPDPGALQGMAVVGVNHTNGIWQYTLNGSNWFAIGNVSLNQARLLPADAKTAVRFVPDPNYHGVVYPFAYKAWDQTTGTAGGIGDATLSGGSTAFSTGTSTTSLRVTAVNDAPVADDDFYSLSANASLEVPADGVLLNDADVDSDTITAVLVGGPAHAASFTLNADGSFRYTPVANWSGNDTFTYKASDGSLASAVATVSLTVTPVAPTITTQPQSQTVTAGQSVSLSVVVSGSQPMRYLWCRDGLPVPGGTNSSLILNPVRTADAGCYAVCVTNSVGSAASTAAILTVTNPPSTLSVSGSAGMTPEGFSLGLSVPLGSTYVIEASSNNREWKPIATNLALTAEVVFTDATAANHAARFYRALVR